MYSGNLQNTGVYDTRAARYFGEQPNWTFQAQSPITCSPVVADGTIFFATRPGLIHAVDTATGAEKWVFNSEEDVINAPEVGGGVVVLTNWANRMVALDIQSGQPIPTNLETNDDFCSPPRIVENLLVMGGADSIYVFELPEIRLRWSLVSVAGCYLASCPAVANGNAYFAGDRGAIAGLDLREGQSLRYDFTDYLFTVHDPVFYNGILYVFVSESDDPTEDVAPPSRTLLAWIRRSMDRCLDVRSPVPMY